MPPTDTSGVMVVPSIALWKAQPFCLLWWLWCEVSSFKAKDLSGVEWNFLSPCFNTHQEVLFGERWAVSCCPAVKWILSSGPRLPTDRQPLCLFTAVKWASGVTNTNTHKHTWKYKWRKEARKVRLKFNKTKMLKCAFDCGSSKPVLYWDGLVLPTPADRVDLGLWRPIYNGFNGSFYGSSLTKRQKDHRTFDWKVTSSYPWTDFTLWTHEQGS